MDKAVVEKSGCRIWRLVDRPGGPRHLPPAALLQPAPVLGFGLWVRGEGRARIRGNVTIFRFKPKKWTQLRFKNVSGSLLNLILINHHPAPNHN